MARALAAWLLVAAALAAPASAAPQLPWPTSRAWSRPAPVIGSSVTVASYYDVDADGVRDTDEPNLNLYSFRVLDGDGALVRSSVTRHGRITFGGLSAGGYALEQRHPDETGAWFTTTGNERTGIDLAARERFRIAVGTAHAQSGSFLPRDTWSDFPWLIPDRAVGDPNALAPFSAEPFASASEVASFLAEEPATARGGLAREIATFVVGFDRLAGSPRCALEHQDGWREARTLAEEAAETWQSGTSAEMAAMRDDLAALNSQQVRYVPLEAPIPTY